MSDLELTKEQLGGHTLALAKDGSVETSDLKGIAPLIKLVCERRTLHGYSAADRIVGKAAAMLYVLLDISAVYAEVLSEAGEEIFKKYGISYGYSTLTEKIINRKGDGMCPMEEAVAEIENPAEAFEAIRAAMKRMKGN